MNIIRMFEPERTQFFRTEEERIRFSAPIETQTPTAEERCVRFNVLMWLCGLLYRRLLDDDGNVIQVTITEELAADGY